MPRISVAQTINVYEVDGKEIEAGTQPALGINSHWNRNELVVIHYGKVRVTIVGNDLIEAVRNAMNTK